MTEQLQWLQREWASRLASAIESMTGSPASAEAATGGAVETGDDAAIFCQPVAVGANSQIWISVPHATWQAIGEQVLESAGLDASSGEESRGTFIEVLQQSLSSLAQVIGGKLRRETPFPPGALEASAPAELVWMPVQITVAGRNLPSAAFAISSALDRALAGPGAEESSTSAAKGGGESPPAQRAARGSKTMDLLLEVELPVGVSFGRVQMKLRDAVKLTTGSIVELNRRVTEPVEVIVNNCVIARGEVVVVEGNYGVRIQEIVSREERLRTLF